MTESTSANSALLPKATKSHCSCGLLGIAFPRRCGIPNDLAVNYNVNQTVGQPVLSEAKLTDLRLHSTVHFKALAGPVECSYQLSCIARPVFWRSDIYCELKVFVRSNCYDSQLLSLMTAEDIVRMCLGEVRSVVEVEK